MPTAPIRDIITYYEEAGSGEPLVLIRGLGSDLQAWAPQLPALAAKFRVITFDNRGAGRTSAPDRPYSIAGMADDVAALMTHLGIAKARVLGLSMGGMIAQELALKHPGRVERLVLAATTAAIDAPLANIVRSWIDVRRSNLSREQTVRLTANWLYSPAFMADTARFEAAVRANVANPYAQPDHGFIRQAEALLAFDASTRASGIKQPTLVVSSTEDILIPPRHGQKLASLIPGAKLAELPGGHVGLAEDPDVYNAAFLAHLGG